MVTSVGYLTVLAFCRGIRTSLGWCLDASTPPGTRPSGVRRSVVSDGREIAQGLVADVGPALDDLFGRRPLLVADLAGAEDVATTPASLHVFDAFEQHGVCAAL